VTEPLKTKLVSCSIATIEGSIMSDKRVFNIWIIFAGVRHG